MLIDTEGKPGVMVLLEQSPTDTILWAHCFGTGPILDNKINRVTVSAILAAHTESADFVQALRRKAR